MSIIGRLAKRRPTGEDSHSPATKSQFGFDQLEARIVFNCLSIAEIVASNKLGITDSDGDRSDWIEIRNDCDETQSLNGWYLTDRSNRPRKWAFPDVGLSPNEQIVLFASGKDRTDPNSELHTNFKLKQSGEFLALVSPHELTWESKFFPTYPQQRSDVSYGQLPSRLDLEHRFYAVPSPSLVNTGENYLGIVEEVEFSRPSGLHDESFMFDFYSNTEGATIIFTTDGSRPSLQNGVQVSPQDATTNASHTLNVDSTLTIRAIAVKKGYLPSTPTTATHVFLNDIAEQDKISAAADGWPEIWGPVDGDYHMAKDVIESEEFSNSDLTEAIKDSLFSLPSVSILMDTEDLFGTDGIYVNPTQRGIEWERTASIEFFDSELEEALQIEAGVRIHGDASRSLLETGKKSLRLHFRDRYESKFNAPGFLTGLSGLNGIESLVLRANFHDGWQEIDAEDRAQYIRDEWYRETFRKMGHLSPSGTFVHLYLNGLYWGLYNAVERPDESFLSRHLGGDPSEWHIAERDIENEKTETRWEQLLNLAAQVKSKSAWTSNRAFDQLLGECDHATTCEPLLDIENYIDYMILNIYGGTGDWPSKNWYAIDRDGDDKGFQFLPWDAEISLHRGSPLSTDQTNLKHGVAELYSNLRANSSFRDRFEERVRLHFSEGGVFFVDPMQPKWQKDTPQNNEPAARYAELADDVELGMIAESSRWGDQHRIGRSYTVDDWRAERDYLLSTYFPARASIVREQLVDAGLVDRVLDDTDMAGCCDAHQLVETEQLDIQTFSQLSW